MCLGMRACEYEATLPTCCSSHVVKCEKRFACGSPVHVPVGSRLSGQPSLGISGERLTPRLFVPGLGGRKARISVIHLDGIEIPAQIQEIGDTASLVSPFLGRRTKEYVAAVATSGQGRRENEIRHCLTFAEHQ